MSKLECFNCPFCKQEKEQSMTLEEIDKIITQIKNRIDYTKKIKHELTKPARKSAEMSILWFKQELKELKNKREKLIKKEEGENIE